MDLTIRRYTDADAEDVVAIEHTCQPNPWPLARFEAFSTLVAEVEGQVVGLACYSINHTIAREESLLLANLSVLPAWRRQGIGRALLEARLRIGAAGRARSAFTITRVSNEPLRALYRPYGFTEGPRLPGYYGAEDGLVLQRALCPEADPPWGDPPPNATTEQLGAAAEALGAGEPERALRLLEPLVGEPGTEVLARIYRAYALEAMGRAAEAIADLERLTREVDEPLVRVALGERYFNASLVDRALGHLLAAIPIAADGASVRLWCFLGLAWERLERFPEAAWAYGQAIKASPADAWGYGRLASAYLRIGSPARALEVADTGLTPDDGSAELHRTRGMALWKLGRSEDAQCALERAAMLQADGVEIRVALALLKDELLDVVARHNGQAGP